MTPTQADLFDQDRPTPEPAATGSPHHEDGSVDAHYHTDRQGRKWYHPALGPAKPRDFQAELHDEVERRAQKREAKNNPRFEGSRQMADRIDREQKENEE